MNKLYTKNAAIKYLRELTGSMSLHTFEAEIAAGRIPVKPYGNTSRFRQEDLDLWAKITITPLSESTNVATHGTRISRSALMDTDLSFVKRLGAKMKRRQHNIA